MKIFLTACSFLAFISANALSGYANTITDPFTCGIDPSNWTITVAPPISGPPTSVVGTNNRVEVTLGGIDTSIADPASRGLLNYSPTVNGNFMATVDFALLDWDPILSRGIRVGLGANMIGVVERIGDPSFSGNSYLVDFTAMGGTIGGITPALGYSGSLKIKRFADTISGYYMDPTTNGDWVLISAQEKFYAGPTFISFGSWAHTDDAIGRQIAFDNFTLTQHPVPEPSTMLLLGSGLVGLIGYGRRRLKK